MQMQYNHTGQLLIQIIHNYSKCSLVIYCNWPNGTGNWWHNWIVVLEKWQGLTQRGMFQGKGGTDLIWSPQSGFPSCFSREVWIISESQGSGPHGSTSISPIQRPGWSLSHTGLSCAIWSLQCSCRKFLSIVKEATLRPPNREY